MFDDLYETADLYETESLVEEQIPPEPLEDLPDGLIADEM